MKETLVRIRRRQIAPYQIRNRPTVWDDLGSGGKGECNTSYRIT